MNGNNITVRLNPGQIELLLTKKLCGKDGAVLSDRREIETSGGKSILLVFSRFYKRFASLFGLTVVINPGDTCCEVSWNAACGRKDAPIVGDMGAAKAFCGDVRKALEPYEIKQS